jgi:hypothetical protein
MSARIAALAAMSARIAALAAMRKHLAAVLLALALAWTPASAQDTIPRGVVRDTLTLLQRFNLDKLRLTAFGASVGAVKPSQVVATQSYALHADYGHIAARWRVLFSATFWGSRYTDETLRTFGDTLRKVIRDSTADYQLALGQVDISDIALGTELRWMSPRPERGWIRPYVGGGLAAHVINAEGRAISGTFVERALDNITAGVIATAGVDAIFLRRYTLGMQARYDLLSGARFGSIRLVGSYIFEPDAGYTNVPPAGSR